MMKKNFDITNPRLSYLKNFISYEQFLTMQTDVIFSNEFRQPFFYDNNNIFISYKNKMKCGVKYCKMVYPFIHVYVNDRIAYSILETEFRTMNYEDFMNILLKCTSNDFVDSYFRSQKIQMNLGDYGL